jgi:LysM repeat protein
LARGFAEPYFTEISELKVKFTLIKSKKQEPVSCHGLKIVPKVGAGSGRARVNILTPVLVLTLLVSLSLPFTANASVFSFLADLFSSGQANASQEVLPNSQNMALLVAAISPASNGATTESGQISIVSDTSLSPETQSPLPPGQDQSPGSDQISVYVVHTGDTLPAIAKMFGVTQNTIIWANNLKNGKISVGDQLVILPISGVQYKVVKGDTLSSIVKKTKGNLDDILSYNNLQSDSKLAVGDTVFVPDGEMSSSESGGGSSSSSGSNSGSGSLAGGGSSISYNSFTPETGNSKILTGSGSIPVGAYCQNYPTIMGYYERPVHSRPQRRRPRRAKPPNRRAGHGGGRWTGHRLSRLRLERRLRRIYCHQTRQRHANFVRPLERHRCFCRRLGHTRRSHRRHGFDRRFDRSPPPLRNPRR